jgi:hypothetical protein
VSGLLAFDLPLVEFSPFAGLPDADLRGEGQRAPAPGRGASRPPLLPAREELSATSATPSIPGASPPGHEPPPRREPATGASAAPPVFSLRRSSRPATAEREPSARGPLTTPQASGAPSSRARTLLEPSSAPPPGTSVLPEPSSHPLLGTNAYPVPSSIAHPGTGTSPEPSSIPLSGKGVLLEPSSPAFNPQSPAAPPADATPGPPSPPPGAARRATGSPAQVSARGTTPGFSAATANTPASLLNDLADEILAASPGIPATPGEAAQRLASRPAPPVESGATAPRKTGTAAMTAPATRHSPPPIPGQAQGEGFSVAHGHPALAPAVTTWPRPVEPGVASQPPRVTRAHPALEAIDALANELLGTSSRDPNGAGLRPAPGLARPAPADQPRSPAAPALEAEPFEEFQRAQSGPQSALSEIVHVGQNRGLWSPARERVGQEASESNATAVRAERSTLGQWLRTEPGPEPPSLDADTLALLVNEALVEQARRHGVDLS